MSTAGDLIKSSLRLIGALSTNETPTASELSDALDVFNDLLEEWSNDGFMIFETKIEEFTLNGSQQDYTIGNGGNFNTERPMFILAAKIKQTNGYEIPLDIYNYQEWASISFKNEVSNWPEVLFYNPEWPLGKISLWPIPSDANKLVLFSQKRLTSIPSGATTLSFPPGYKKALRYNLAAELAVEYGKAINPKLEQVAIDSKAAIQRTNTTELLMVPDAFGLNERRHFNIYTGEYE